jgi:hypothetical protein
MLHANSTNWDWIIYCDIVCLTMKYLIFYGNVTMELREDTLAERKLLERSCKKDYGGQQCLKMLRNILETMMYLKEWGNHHTMMNCIYTMFTNYKPLKNGVVDFTSLINPPANNSKERYINTTTDYLTRWDEKEDVLDFSTTNKVYFIFDNVITRFGFPWSLTSDQRSHFLNETFVTLTREFMIQHHKSSPYHPIDGNNLPCSTLRKSLGQDLN